MAVKPFIKVLIFVSSALFAAYLFREFVISREAAQITQISRLIKWQMDSVTPKKVEDEDKINLLKDNKENTEEKIEEKKEGKKEESKEGKKEEKKEEGKEEKKEEKEEKMKEEKKEERKEEKKVEGKKDEKKEVRKDEKKDEKKEVRKEERKEEKKEDKKEGKKQVKEDLVNDKTTTITINTNKLTNLMKENNTGPQLIEISKIWRVKQDNLTLCPEIPPNLKGKIDVDMRSLKLEEIEEEYKDLWPGGHWRPKECKSRQKVAIVVPYRNREPHLRTFLHNIHRFLQKQQLDYAIFIVEQMGTFAFNKGRLTNIGVLEAIRVYPFDCIIFHDVDTYPENDNILYRCSTDPKHTKHLSVYLERIGYKEYYPGFIGGVLALTVEQLRKVNGYSNDFWGWGGEDDDLNTRVKIANMSFHRNKTEISRFRSFKHDKDAGNEPHKCRFKLIKMTKEKYLTDGFSNLNYRVEFINFGKLYTHIMVDVLEEEYNRWKKYIKKIGC